MTERRGGNAALQGAPPPLSRPRIVAVKSEDGDVSSCSLCFGVFTPPLHPSPPGGGGANRSVVTSWKKSPSDLQLLRLEFFFVFFLTWIFDSVAINSDTDGRVGVLDPRPHDSQVAPIRSPTRLANRHREAFWSFWFPTKLRFCMKKEQKRRRRQN